MRKPIATSLVLLMIISAMVLPQCDVEETRNDGPNKITLIWNKSYLSQTRDDIKRGLIWDLSWLGAELPAGSFEKACEWKDSTTFTINLDSVGFAPTACEALDFICDSIRRSEEYKHYGGIDVGKFVMLTLGSTWHYYEITGAPETLAEFRKKYQIDTSAYLFGVTNSTIAEGHRKINFSRDTALFHCGFMAEEGEGSLDSGSFTATMYECFDVMPNGQLRFMIYDANGNLAAGTPEHIGDAGKPTKCLWCHETVIQPLFIENRAVRGLLSNEEFLSFRDSMQVRLERYRLSLKTDMDWKNVSDHTLGELLYITFMEPTMMHLENEWKLSAAEVKVIIGKAGPRKFEEFDFIGEVYDRAHVDHENWSHVRTLYYSMSARETGDEVNYFGR